MIKSFSLDNADPTNLGEHMYEFHKGEEWDEVYSCQYCEIRSRVKGTDETGRVR